MSEPKLYKHRENGEVVAAFEYSMEFKHTKTSKECVCYMSPYFTSITKHTTLENFKKEYTPLPEAPEVGSTAWAVWMLNSGEKLENPTEVHGNYIYKVMDEVCFADGWVFRDFQNYLFKPNHTWRLYEEPKPIVECLPHEFSKYDKILWRNTTANRWTQGRFIEIAENGVEYVCDWPHVGIMNRNHFHQFVIPYAENSHLEGQITDGEHGAVPRGYVPPHVPQLGDDDYWLEGDDIVNLSTNKEYSIVVSEHNRVTFYPKKSNNDNIFLPLDALNGGYWNGHRYLRVWYHKGSYVKEDGTVHEYVPTRSHYIIQK